MPGTISLTSLGAAATENFDSLSNTAGSTTNTLTLNGWYMTESGGGARDNEQYGVDTGASTTGDTYSYGAAASTDRAFGTLRSGTLIPLFGAEFTNNTGSTITSLDIAFMGEEWRLGTAGRTDQLTFEYSTNATDLVTGTWTSVAGLNFTTPDTATAGAKNGNAAADRTAISSTISGLSIPDGATIFIRWGDPDATGADDGLAIDDFSLTPHGSTAVTPSLSINDVSHSEGNAGTATYTFTVSLNQPAPAGGVTFDIATADGTATSADGDYLSKTLSTQTIAAGQTSYTFDVLVVGDTAVEPNQTFFVNLTNVVGANVADGQGQGTIVNDDIAGAFSIADASVFEGNSGTTPITFTVSRDAASNVAAAVHYDVNLPGGAGGADSSDLAPGANLSGDLSFAAGETSKTITLQVHGDSVIEPDETFTVSLSAPTNGATIADGSATGTIANDDSGPVASINDVTIVEGQNGVTYATFTVSLNFAPSGPVTIDYATANGSANAGSDYLATTGTLSFATGETSQTISVPIVGDTISEPNETFTITLGNPSGATIGDGSGVGTIADDDGPAYFALNSGSLSENWTDTGRITANDDWSNIPSIRGYLGDIDPAGAQTGVDPRTLTGANIGQIDVIANLNNASSTSGGVGEFQLANPTIGLQGSGTADAPSIVLFMDSRGRSDVHLTATLRDIDGTADNAAQPIDVQYRTDPNGSWTNAPGGYFVDVTTGPSQATQTTALDITLPADADNAANLQIRILTTNAAGNDEWVGIDDIVVSSNQGPPSYSIADAAAFEGNSGTTPISFTVSRVGDISAAGSVGYTVDLGSDGFSASAGDFASALSGTVGFAAGETSKTLTLNIAGDTLPEADEGFTVTLHNPSSGNLGDAGATGTIVNDDGPPPLVTISDVTQAEGDSGATTFTFTVSRTGGTTPFTLDYSTADGSAHAGSDYVAASGSLSFGANENSKTISVTVNGDAAPEHTETFSVNLSNPAGAVIADPTALGTILNDDLVPIYQIQGAGHISTFNGEAVRTQGIVTAVGANGFYLQDATGDGNSATSDAIFVFTGGAPTVALGDAVTVSGIVNEFAADATNLTTTEINTPTIVIDSHDHALPNAVVIGVDGILPPTTILDNDGLTSYDPATDGLDFYELLEGMRVTIETPIAVSNTNSFGETYVVASDGVGATGMNSRGGITISGDHVGTPVDYNPERIQIDDDATIFGGFHPDYTQGDQLSNVSGILSYSHDSYEVLVTAPVTVTQDVTLQQETTALDGDNDHLTIADYNIENADPGDPQLKFDLLAHNIVYNLKTPDIVSLQEVQDADGAGSGSDFSGYATAQKLIDAIAAAGGPVYSYVEVTPTGSTGGEANGHIHPGFLYDPTRVSYIAGSAAIIDDPAYAGSRNPLIAKFVFNSQTVELIDVHFTSRLGSDELEGAIQPPADAGDASRTAQGQAVADYVAGELASNPALKLGVLGDFNGFYFEGAVGAIEATGLTDLLRTLPSEERYTYEFDGNAQAIDHIIVSPGLFTGTQFDAVHLNSEFDNNPDRPTDHDSVIARFSIAHPDPVILPATDALGTVVELPDHDPNENFATLQDSGTILFSNPDPALTHTAVATAQGGGYVGSFTLGGVDQSGHSVGWSFALSDADLNALGAGQVRQQFYTVTIDDGHGGTVDKVVEVDLVGTNDAAHLSSANVVVEQGAAPATASGSLTITDEDNPASFVPQASASGQYGHFTIDAAGHWSYMADQVYTLAPGQFRTDVFTVLAVDGTPTTVAVTIGGHDAPAIARQDLFSTDEAHAIGAGLSLFADNGSGADSDPDGALSISAVNGIAGSVGQLIALPSGAVVRVNADGTFSYDPNHAFDWLTNASGAANQLVTDSFTYTLAGGSTATVFVDVSGLNSPGDRIYGSVGDNVVTGFDTADSFLMQQGGHDQVRGQGGDDGFYFGNALDSGDKVDGGDGTDTLAIQGNTNVTLGDVTSVEVLAVLSGSDPSFGDTANNRYSYDIVTNDGNVAPDETLTVIATGLLPGENLHFDGSAETDGNFAIYAGQGVDDLTGGGGSDGFFFGAGANLTGADHVDGGAGIDSLALRGNYVGADAVVFTDASMANIEVVALLSGHTNEYSGQIVPAGFDYDVTMADGNVAAGDSLDVIATGLGADEKVRFDGRVESDGSFRILSGGGDDTLYGGSGNDIIYGGLGADRLEGGAGGDSYVYRSAAESSSTGYDTITGFDWHNDTIDIPGSTARAFTQAGSGALSTASFDADLAAGLNGVLGANQAALFTASSGTLSGHLFAVIDLNGTAGYQAGEDLVVELVSPAAPIDTHALVIA